MVYDPCNFDDGVVSKVAQVAGDAGAVITGGLSGKAAGVAVGGGNVGECISYSIVNFLYDWVLWTTIQIAGLAGTLFNASIQFSLTGKVFDADENKMIKDGWTFVRDLLNLVFIFILLFAAISTILQYGGFEIKKYLAQPYCRRLAGQFQYDDCQNGDRRFSYIRLGIL